MAVDVAGFWSHPHRCPRAPHAFLFYSGQVCAAHTVDTKLYGAVPGRGLAWSGHLIVYTNPPAYTTNHAISTTRIVIAASDHQARPCNCCPLLANGI